MEEEIAAIKAELDQLRARSWVLEAMHVFLASRALTRDTMYTYDLEKFLDEMRAELPRTSLTDQQLAHVESAAKRALEQLRLTGTEAWRPFQW